MIDESSAKVMRQGYARWSWGEWIVAIICFVVIADVGAGLCYTLWYRHQTKVQERFLESMDKRLKDRITINFFDPESAKFTAVGIHFKPLEPGQETESHLGTFTMCGFVNAKNRYGGYVGGRPFYSAVKFSSSQPEQYEFGIADAPDNMELAALERSQQIIQIQLDRCISTGAPIYSEP